ncbi:L-ornithine 5-monooxygenase oxidoreductase protein [Candidatus Jidaibacter acanthamoeba]|uniref:L-ornithine 5-monooxygenase oxidoreductase protein n=1 Tax=Candidatus Jidaibacter acanthamoebae TaxID=86105 RepID=A0A0C1QNR1_9RICK|nr:SidA/IucD/PvdA family monooxygenase [Candidatus Jidaibacter acanthamoeba]KIE05688.1 L-ornithine 5-monooxygenase oxidoreductase protein [Candidatus Jidaibacter acanthamoeba]
MINKIYDFIGIGFGPSNISLAIILEEQKGLSYKFIESAPNSIWQPEMMLDGADIQNNPIRDLISIKDPRSKYTFINYLHENNKLVKYLNLGLKFPLRREYALYVEWCASHFKKYVDYNKKVNEITLIKINGENIYKIKVGTNEIYHSRSLVLGTGRMPHIPKEYENLSNLRIFHLTSYLSSLAKFEHNRIDNYKIAVIGASQSAVEIILDLNKKFPNAEIHNIIRKFSIKLKDTSPFSYEIYYPEYIDLFYNLPLAKKEKLREEVRATNYSTVDEDVLNSLYLTIYEQKLNNKQRIFVHNNSKVHQAEIINDKVRIKYSNEFKETREYNDYDFVILATGFRDIGFRENQEPYPKILEKVISYFSFNELNYIDINRDYSLKNLSSLTPPIYLNGLCETSHGLGDAGSFSSIPIRNSYIANSLFNHFIKINKAVG